MRVKDHFVSLHAAVKVDLTAAFMCNELMQLRTSYWGKIPSLLVFFLYEGVVVIFSDGTSGEEEERRTSFEEENLSFDEKFSFEEKENNFEEKPSFEEELREKKFHRKK